MRTAAHLATVHLDTEACKGCNLCIDVCPNDLFQAATPQTPPNAQGFLPVHMRWPEYCINCLRCVEICPDDAFVVPEEPLRNLNGHVFGLSLKWHRFWNGGKTP